jgi:hypothetical protein
MFALVPAGCCRLPMAVASPGVGLPPRRDLHLRGRQRSQDGRPADRRLCIDRELAVS